MGGHHTSSLPTEPLLLPENHLIRKLPIIGAVLAVLGIGGALAFGGELRAFSYLTGYIFWLGVALGALFFVLVFNLARASWNIALRRIVENMAMTLPMLAVLFIPILYFMGDLYHHWLHPEGDPILEGKAAYLNVTFFLVRTAMYFVFWCGMAWLFRKHSVDQDADGDRRHTAKRQSFAAPGIAIFALTLTFASFDWIMSIDAHWFSTMFGVYYFAGANVAFYAVLAAILLWLTSTKRQKAVGGIDRVVSHQVLHGIIRPDHLHDVGKMMFGFNIFWTYVTFSQYFLIWYSNIPEETLWFAHHFENGWETSFWVLGFGHFLFPFLFLISRNVKRSRLGLLAGAAWLLLMHGIDMQWLVMPMASHGGVHAHFGVTLAEVLSFIGVGGAFIGTWAHYMCKSSLVPIKDPYLKESMSYEVALS